MIPYHIQIISYYIISYHIISYSYHIISYHNISHFTASLTLISNLLDYNLKSMSTGISPLLTSGLITSFMSSSNIFNFETDQSLKMTQTDRRKRTEKVQKLLAVILCFFQAAAYVLSGMYGKLDVVGVGNATMIVLQVMIVSSHVTFFYSFIYPFSLFYFLQNIVDSASVLL